MTAEESKFHSSLDTLREVKPGTFLFEKDRALPHGLCDDIIRRFEEAPDEQYPGRIGQTENEDFSVKRSTDIYISGKPQWKDVDAGLFGSLAAALAEFRRAFPYFRGRFKDAGYGIQRTRAGEFYHWHVDGGSHSFSARQLVAIWYLNDVEDGGGETEFFVQRVCIRPRCGKLLLFPPFWTHEHRGRRLQRGVKYIATTWVLFA